MSQQFARTEDLADLDSGAGIDEHQLRSIGLPGDGGHVVGGTLTNPLAVNLTGNTQSLLGSDLQQDFGEILLVAPSTETTLVSLTVASGKILRVKGVSGEGKVDGIFRVFIDSAKKWQARNSWTERNINDIIELDATAGQVITLKVIHSNALSKPFSGSIYAYERDA